MKRHIGTAAFLVASLLLIPAAGLGPGPVLAASSPPPTLTGESFSGTSYGNTNTFSCNTDSSGTFTFTASGTATGPYSGPYTESGTGTVVGANHALTAFFASFTIQSPTGIVTGTKTLVPDPGTLGSCAGFEGSTVASATYQATISTASGNYRDQGTATVGVVASSSGRTINDETFTSSLTQPVPIEPTSTSQCKNGGYMNYPQFKNQGQCVAYVENSQGGA